MAPKLFTTITSSGVWDKLRAGVEAGFEANAGACAGAEAGAGTDAVAGDEAEVGELVLVF